MVALLRRQRLNLPLAPFAALAFGVLTALVFALMPGRVLESLVVASGIASVMPAAEPPLGLTARAGLILAGGGGVGLVAWFALFLLLGSRVISLGAGGAGDELPVLRRADAHPDAPARRPVFANRDLGTPFLEVRAGRAAADKPAAEPVPSPESPPELPLERPIPADLDAPLAAYDPAAIPATPLPWSSPTAPIAAAPPPPRLRTIDPADRFETFELTPMVRTPPPPPPAAVPAPALASVSQPAPTPQAKPQPSPVRSPVDPTASIHALLDRLERGVGRRAPEPAPPPPPREDTLQDALVSLRRLAMRG